MNTEKEFDEWFVSEFGKEYTEKQSHLNPLESFLYGIRYTMSKKTWLHLKLVEKESK